MINGQIDYKLLLRSNKSLRDCWMYLGHTYVLSQSAHTVTTHTQHKILLDIPCYVIMPKRESERERQKEALIRHHTLLTAVCQTLTGAMLLFPSCDIQMACFVFMLTCCHSLLFMQSDGGSRPQRLRCFKTDKALCMMRLSWWKVHKINCPSFQFQKERQ